MKREVESGSNHKIQQAIEKKLVKMKLADLIPYKNNPRKNEKTVKVVAESIEQTGYNNPIIVDEDRVILAGHTRRLALMQKKVKEVEVIQVFGMSEENKRKFRLLDNKVGEYATWDREALLDELSGLEWGELEIDWGFDVPSIEMEEEGFKYECPECGFKFNA